MSLAISARSVNQSHDGFPTRIKQDTPHPKNAPYLRYSNTRNPHHPLWHPNGKAITKIIVKKVSCYRN
jgi:hypothetical protein